MRHNYGGGNDAAPQSQAPQLHPVNNSGGGDSQYENSNSVENGSGGSQGNNGASNSQGDSKEDSRRSPPFTMHGVLHYLQHEWSRYELERAQWEMERAELRARISFLVGERKGQENLKHDLVRRIKMLEYSLKQERAKLHRMTHTHQLAGDQSTEREEDLDEHFNQGAESNVPMDIDALGGDKNDGTPNANSQAWKEARQVLRQYLQEIGYSEKILDVRSFRVKNLLGLIPDNNNWNQSADQRKEAEKALLDSEQALLNTAEIIKQSRKYDVRSDDSDSDDNEDTKQLDVDAVEALDEFSFLKNEKSNASNTNDKWSYNQSAFEHVKEEFRLRTEENRKKHMAQGGSLAAAMGKGNPPSKHFGCGDEEGGDGGFMGSHNLNTLDGGPPRSMDVNAALGLTTDDFVDDIKDDFAGADEDSFGTQQKWSIRFTLRSHYDSIRAMQFHPVNPVLITASEDGTARLWDLNSSGSGGSSSSNTIKSSGSMDGSSKNANLATGILDMEPVYTFRGHKGPILAMDMSPTGDMCYTGGFDGSICCWSVPSGAIEVYQNYDPTVLQERLRGHTDCVWAVAFHSSTNRLISASADGTVRLWESGVADGMQSLVKTFMPPQPDSRPRSIDIVSTDPQQLLTAYSRANCSILDLETGRNVLGFDLKQGSDGDFVGEVNKILSHPTMPVTVMAGEDRKIRYFDNNTGKLIHGTVAHVEGISTLAIDPNGLYLLSGSHDGSLRLWNMEKRVCLQEIAAHRKKYDMSVMAVAFHPSRPLIASAGADSLAKVFGTTQPSSSSFSNIKPAVPCSSVTSSTATTPTMTTTMVQQPASAASAATSTAGARRGHSEQN